MSIADCGDPIPVKNADIVPGPRTIGSLQNYVCIDGMRICSP